MAGAAGGLGLLDEAGGLADHLDGGGGDQIAQALELDLGQAGHVGDVAVGVALDLGELADLAQELRLADHGRIGAQAAAGEDEADQLGAEPDRGRDHVEAEVTLVHVRGRRLAGTAGAAGLEVVLDHAHALVAAAEAFLGEQGQAAQLVLGREDLAVGVIEHVARGIGERQLQTPPAPQHVADERHGWQLTETAEVDHSSTIACAARVARREGT